jgi:hypothetical protein
MLAFDGHNGFIGAGGKEDAIRRLQTISQAADRPTPAAVEGYLVSTGETSAEGQPRETLVRGDSSRQAPSRLSGSDDLTTGAAVAIGGLTVPPCGSRFAWLIHGGEGVSPSLSRRTAGRCWSVLLAGLIGLACTGDVGNPPDESPDVGAQALPTGANISDALVNLGNAYRVTGRPSAPLDIGEKVRLGYEPPPSGNVIAVPTALGDLQELQVSVTASWSVLNEASVEQKAYDKVSEPGGTYIIEESLDEPEATFTLRPPIMPTDWQEVDPSPVRWEIELTLTLEASGVAKTEERTIPVELPRVGVPVLVAMFIDEGYATPQGLGALVLIRGSSKIEVACSAVADRLAQVDQALNTLQLFGAAVGLPEALRELADLPVRSHCSVGYSFPDLSMYRYFDQFGLLGKITAEDTTSSLVMVGPPGASAVFFNDRGWFNERHTQSEGPFTHNHFSGRFTLTLSDLQLSARLPALQRDGSSPFIEADDNPEGKVLSINNPPPDNPGTFNENLSAVFFPGPDRELVLKTGQDLVIEN